MQCRACGAEMRLMKFVLGDTTGRVPAIERQDFKCSACPQVARRVVFSRALVSADELLATHTEPRAIQPQIPRSAGPQRVEKAPSWVKWARAVEKLHTRQAELLKKQTAPRAEAIQRPAQPANSWPDVA
jgi:hypothetical protein